MMIPIPPSRASRLCLAAFFVVAGTLHFVNPGAYLLIVPSWVPQPLWAVYVSGFLEIFFGALILFPRTRRIAAWGLLALLVAVFPANLNMAFHPDLFPRMPAWIYWLRLPFQAVLIAWVWACREDAESTNWPRA